MQKSRLSCVKFSNSRSVINLFLPIFLSKFFLTFCFLTCKKGDSNDTQFVKFFEDYVSYIKYLE